jgi:hypothetical protein
MMKAFIERCSSRVKDGSHTKTVCDMQGSVLACEVALTSSKTNTTAAMEENLASVTTRSCTIQCRLRMLINSIMYYYYSNNPIMHNYVL